MGKNMIFWGYKSISNGLNLRKVGGNELYNHILNVNENICDDLIEGLRLTNREVVKLLLLKIQGSKNIGFIRFLRKWEVVEVKKVRQMINAAINKLKSVD
jgi:hypothetical protein